MQRHIAYVRMCQLIHTRMFSGHGFWGPKDTFLCLEGGLSENKTNFGREFKTTQL